MWLRSRNGQLLVNARAVYVDVLDDGQVILGKGSCAVHQWHDRV